MHLFFTEENKIIDKGMSRDLLYKAIVRYSEISGREIPTEEIIDNLKSTENGKPYIEKFPSFSISHTENIWGVIFSEKNCGLDIQVVKNGDFIKIGEKVFSKNDVEKIKKLGEKAFFRLWARKEAYIKAFGGTIFEGVPDLFSPEDRLHVNGYTVFDIELIGETYSAICVEGIVESLKLEKVRL